MKNKVLLKSLFHIAQLTEQAQKLMKKKIIIDTFNDSLSHEDFHLYTGCIEKDNMLYNKNGVELADSGLIESAYYKYAFYAYPYWKETRYYKIKDGIFVGMSFWDSITIDDSCKLLDTIFEIASLQSKINKILSRNQVAEEFEDMTFFKIEGFERNCIEQNSALYAGDGYYIADGDKYEPTGMIDDLYYVNQHSGYLEDDYYGTMYYKISDKLFVKVSYSC